MQRRLKIRAVDHRFAASLDGLGGEYMRASISKRCVYRTIGSKVFIENLDDPFSRHVLGGSATKIWTYLEQGASIEAIIKQVSETFKAPAYQVERDVTALLCGLHKKGVILAPDLKGPTGAENRPGESRSADHSDGPDGTTIYEQLVREIAEKKMVIKAHIEITYTCNFRCVQCYVGPLLNDKQISRNQMTTGELTNLITQLADQGCMHLTFTGGELFTRGDIFEVLEHASSKRFAIRLQTNGSLITEQTAKRLQEIPTIDTIEVSFFGTDRETSEQITGIKNSLERATNALRWLKAYGLPAYLKYVLMKQNLAGFERAKELAQEVGVRFISGMGNIYPTTTGGKKNLEYLVSEEETLRLMVEGKLGVQQILSDCSSSSWLCKAGIVRCTITPTGEVWPCERLPFSLGNVRGADFKTVWFSERAEWFRSMIEEEHDRCKSCSVKQLCYQCWAMPYLYGDDLSVEEALALKGYSGMSCRMTNIARKAHERLEIEKQPARVYSQVF
jgi:radical SAM protein with 4Fe4S-binding SPASM domain